jgi:hypothetical protein
MNPDLKRRLKTVEQFNGLDRRFLIYFQTQLHRVVGLRLDVEVRFEMIIGDEDDTAYTQGYDDGSFEIIIDSRLSFGEMCDYLVHEFAHVGTWWMNESDDHGLGWGVEYAKLYRLYLAAYEGWFSDVDAIRRK